MYEGSVHRDKELDQILRIVAGSCNKAFQGVFPIRGLFGGDWLKSSRSHKVPGSPLHGGAYAVCEFLSD